MSIILDLIIIAIFVLVAYVSAKHGFVRTLIELAGFIAALLICVPVGNAAADKIYDKTIAPKITQTVEAAATDKPQEFVDKAWEKLPPVLVESYEKLGITKETINEKISQTEGGNLSEKAETAMDAVIRPTVVKFIAVLAQIIIFIVLTIITNILAKFINRLFSWSLFGTINKVLGAGVGVVKGAFYVFVFCVAINLIVAATGGVSVLTPEIIENSHLFKYILTFTPSIF